MKKKKKMHTEELRAFEKASVSDSDQESMNSSSREEGEVWKSGSYELFDFNNNYRSKKFLITQKKILNLDNCINSNYYYEYFRSRLVGQPTSYKKTDLSYILRRKI